MSDRAHGVVGRIRINGEPRPLSSQALIELMTGLGHDLYRPGLAVALNGEVLPRNRWADCRLADGDELEIVAAVQGG